MTHLYPVNEAGNGGKSFVRAIEDVLPLNPIKVPEPVSEMPRLMNPRLVAGLPHIPAATPNDQLAREAAAAVEREDGWEACAIARLRGAYDGDTEHRIALKAIELSISTPRDGSGNATSGNPLPVNK